MPYSGLNDGPVDALPTSQLGGGADDAVSLLPANSLGGGAGSEVIDLIPDHSLGGGANEEILSLIPTDSLGGGANGELVNLIPTSSLGGGSDSLVDMLTTFPTPRTRVTGRGYTTRQGDAVFQEQTERTIDLYAGGQYGILYDSLDDLLAEGIALVCETATGVIATPPSVSIGIPGNPAVLIPTQPLTGFDAVGEVFVLRRTNAITAIVPPGTPIVLTVQAAALGTGTLTASIRPLATLV